MFAIARRSVKALIAWCTIVYAKLSDTPDEKIRSDITFDHEKGYFGLAGG